MYVHYDFSHSSDTESYLKMADGNFNVNPVHRYRCIVPLAAHVVAIPLKAVYTKLWPHRAESLWPLQLAFFIINSFLVAFYGWIVYRLLRLYSNQLTAILTGLIAVLTSRWVAYIAGLPLTDSLYLIAIAALLYSIKTDNKKLFVATVLLGGLMKESFLLFSPLIVLAGPFNWRIRTAFVVLSVCMVFGTHAIIDALFPLREAAGIKSESLVDILMRTSAKTFETAMDLLTVRGMGEIFTVLGIFTFILIYGSANKKCRAVWKTSVETYYWIFFGCILVHVLISGDAARMFYFGAPLYGILITKATEEISHNIFTPRTSNPY
jgi:hypothetical protein